MHRWLYVSFFFAVIFVTARAQNGPGRKLPNITFQPHSTAFANANRAYNENDQYTDTIYDQQIVDGLLAILEQNPGIMIEIGGHTALGEDTLLGWQRAEVVFTYLVEHGIAPERLTPRNHAHRFPIIPDEVIATLPSLEEQLAAHQKNQRAEVKVTGLQE